MSDLLEELHDHLDDEVVVYWDDLTLVARSDSGLVHVSLVAEFLVLTREDNDLDEWSTTDPADAAKQINGWLS